MSRTALRCSTRLEASAANVTWQRPREGRAHHAQRALPTGHSLPASTHSPAPTRSARASCRSRRTRGNAAKAVRRAQRRRWRRCLRGPLQHSPGLRAPRAPTGRGSGSHRPTTIRAGAAPLLARGRGHRRVEAASLNAGDVAGGEASWRTTRAQAALHMHIQVTQVLYFYTL